MKKKISILIIMLGMIMVFAACTKEQSVRNVENVEPEESDVLEENVEPEQDEKSKEYAKILDDVAYVTFGDVEEGIYEESMDFELDEVDVQSLKMLRDEIILEDGRISTYESYRLTLYDENRNKLDSWIVGWAGETETESSGMISEDGKYGEWIDSFEDKYAFKQKGLYTRTPGENYLYKFDEITKISVWEITANNFIPAIDYEVGKEDIEKLKSIKENIVVGKQKYERDDNYYHIEMSTDTGAEVAHWVVDHDGKIFTGEGYEISGDAIEEWRQLIEEKSGLADKREAGE